MNKKALWILCILQFILLILLAAFVLGVFYRSELFPFETEKAPIRTWDDITETTMIQLIATPEKYHGKRIRVVGVGNIEFEGNCIALNKEELMYGGDHRIWVDLNTDEITREEAVAFNGMYVIVEGTFNMKNGGHFDQFFGAIENVDRYTPCYTQAAYNTSVVHNMMDDTYYYSVVDYDGQLLAKEENLTQMPMVDYVSTHVMGVSFQEAGPSSGTATYYELSEGRVSEPFSYVLTAKYDLVVYAEQRDGQHLIVVRDIFDKDDYYKEYILENVSENVADFVTSGEFEAKGKLKITYLTGADKTETELAITLPPRGYAG